MKTPNLISGDSSVLRLWSRRCAPSSRLSRLIQVSRMMNFYNKLIYRFDFLMIEEYVFWNAIHSYSQTSIFISKEFKDSKKYDNLLNHHSSQLPLRLPRINWIAPILFKIVFIFSDCQMEFWSTEVDEWSWSGSDCLRQRCYE